MESLDLAYEEILKYTTINRFATKVNLGYGYSFDLDSMQLCQKQQVISLFPKQKKILFHLIKNREKLLSYDDLCILISDSHEQITTKNSLKNLILDLRKKISVDLIANIHSQGYKISLEK